MPYTDLPCRYSANLRNTLRSPLCPGEHLQLGPDLSAYLYFELPAEAFSSVISNASLILFKIPPRPCAPAYSGILEAAPLLDFFSICANHFTPPQTDISLVSHTSLESLKCFTELNITGTVRAWLLGEPENRGLRLRVSGEGAYIAFASECSDIFGMRPFLRLTYSLPDTLLHTAACTVEISNSLPRNE